MFVTCVTSTFSGHTGIYILGDYLYWESLVNKRVERMVKSGSPVQVDFVVKDVPDILEVKAVKVDAKELQCEFFTLHIILPFFKIYTAM